MKKKVALSLLLTVTLAAQTPLLACATQGPVWVDPGDEPKEIEDDILVNENGSSGAYAGGEGSTLIIDGNVTTTGENSVGAVAENGGHVEITKDVTTSGNMSNGAIACYGEDEAGNPYSVGGTVIIEGSVLTSGNGSKGVEVSGEGSTVEITGNVTTTGEDVEIPIEEVTELVPADGVLAIDGGTAVIQGSVSSQNSNGITSIDEGSNVSVDGNVESTERAGIYAEAGNVTTGGNVVGGEVGVDAKNNAEVKVTGDISATNGTAVIVNNGSSVTVKDGTVTGGMYEDEEVAPGVIVDNTSTIIVENGTVSAGDGEGDALIISLNSSTGDGKIVVNTIKAGDNHSAIFIEYGEEFTPSTNEALLNALPEIIVGEINVPQENYIWSTYLDSLADAQIEEVHEAILQKINYWIGVQDLANGSIEVEGADESGEYLVAKANTELTVKVTADDGYEITSVSGGKVEAVKNEDGTYTITVLDGGGIDISAVIRAIVKAEAAKQASTETAPVVKASAYAVAQNKVQKEIANLPQNATYEVDLKNYISFNRKSFEAFSKRPDLTIRVIYKYQGKRYRVTIPAGYPIMDLLDENGYCGCLYLNKIFGSELIE